MRRTLAAAAAALLTLTLAPQAPATAGNPGSPTAERVADQTLETAQRVLEGDATRRDPSPTIALRDLALAQGRLSHEERQQSAALLARPTDGARDPADNGYTVAARKKCSDVVCVHWVPTTADAPPSRAWVDKNLAVMTAAYRHETATMGYRRPLGDGTRGGNNKFDFYLKDIGDQGLYGYCAPEAERRRYLYSAYCVVDDDFASSQFPTHSPIGNLRVTTAHEFFHAVQYAYDATEDRWMMEASATWMEERFADAVNDNRNYIEFGQLRQQQVPLDAFATYGYAQYGNWLFFEYLSKRYGNGIVRAIWQKAGAYAGAPDNYSTQAIAAVLSSRGGFAANYATYAANNSLPWRNYPEGGAYPATPANRRAALSFGSRDTGTQVFTIDHLASQRMVITPAPSLLASWNLRLRFDGPYAVRAPQFVALVVTNKGVNVVRPTLNRQGDGTIVVRDFRAKRIKRVIVTAVNASRRSSCWHGSDFACQGKPVDDDVRFAMRGVLVR